MVSMVTTPTRRLASSLCPLLQPSVVQHSMFRQTGLQALITSLPSPVFCRKNKQGAFKDRHGRLNPYWRDCIIYICICIYVYVYICIYMYIYI